MSLTVKELLEKLGLRRAELTDLQLSRLRGGARCICGRCGGGIHRCACGVVTDRRYACTDCGRPSWCER